MSFASQLKPVPQLERDSVLEGRFDSSAHATITAHKDVLDTLLCSAPYLCGLAAEEADWLDRALAEDADAAFEALMAELDAAHVLAPDALGPVLRQSKARMALLAGLAELGGVWTTPVATRAMSHFADMVLNTTLGSLMAEAERADKISLPDYAHPASHCGLVIFALGKLGGEELNYSSDIDVVAFFDPMAADLADRSDADRFYIRIVQRLSALIDTGADAAFRVDLRLRPDPGSTQVAISVNAALQYYESRGQNWERAAWIKARTSAGDHQVGEAFLHDLGPFIWRRHLDYATIADVQAMKRQINLARRIGDEEVAGHNVKLGRGGIREIEFFAQTQQLIAGGRNRDLRVRPTTDALDQLAANNWITADAVQELKDSYWYLRAVENRLQMRRNEQTHTVPKDDAERAEIAAMMGLDDLAQFHRQYRIATEQVRARYAELFVEATSLSADTGNLVFTGSENDPGTLQTLEEMGFADPKLAIETVRKWHSGRYPATRASAARAKLTDLLPKLLKSISEAGNADAALKRFDDFLSRLPTGLQLFSLLEAHEYLRRLLVDFMAAAPRLSEAVIHRAHILDGLIDPAFSSEINRRSSLVGKVDGFLEDALNYEDLIDRTHLIGQEQKFLIAAGLLSGSIEAGNAGKQFTALAETLLGRLFTAVRTELAVRHGLVPGAKVALLAFGKMASAEMTATSDLDFILLYDAPEDVEQSDGERPLAPSHYFSRLTQRLIAALSAPTAVGTLYETDMRLRPSGNAGPLATSLKGFTTYQSRDAWTWEHLALTRARVVYADPGLADRIEAAISDILSAPRDRQKIIADVLDMRARLAKDRKPRHPFDLKLAAGGLMDLDFVAQSAQLIGHQQLHLQHVPAPLVFARMGERGWLPEAERLSQIYVAYSTILQAMSACLVEPFREGHWTTSFKDLLARLNAAPDFAFLEADVEAMKADVTAAVDAWYARASEV